MSLLAVGIGGPPGAGWSKTPAWALFLLLAVMPPPAWARAGAGRAGMLVPDKLRRVAVLGDPRFRHAAGITHVLPLPDGKRILTTGRDGSARLWAAATGAELQRYDLPTGQDIWHAALLPGGREFLTAGEGDGVVRWRLDAAVPLRVYKQEGTVFRVAADKAGRRFATADQKKRSILLEVSTGKAVRGFVGHKEAVYTALFSKDGRQVITGSSDGTVRFWDTETGKELRQVKNATGDVYTLAFGPRHKRILVCCEKKSLWLMDPESGKEIWQAKLPDGVYCGAWSPDGKRIAASCQDDSLYVLDAATGKTQWTAKLPSGTNYGVAFTADGREVLCGSNFLLCRFDAKSGTRVYPKPDSPARNTPVASVAVVPGTGAVLRVDGGPGIRVLDRDTGALRAVWLPTEKVTAVSVCPGSRTVLAGGGTSNASLLDAKTGKLLRRLPHGDVRDVAFSPDGRLAITAGRGSNAKPGIGVWRVADGKAVCSLATSGRTTAVSVGPAGGRVAAVCERETVRIWSLVTGQLLREIPLKDRGPSRCAFAAPGEHSLLVREKKALTLWTSPQAGGLALGDAELRGLIRQLGADKYKTRQKATERLIRGGERVLSVLAKVQTKDVEVQIRLAHIQETILNQGNAYEQKDQVALAEGGSTSFCLHPDGRHWAALEGVYSKARIVIGRIDVNKLKVLRRIHEPHVPWVLRFGSDGRLYVGNANGTISVYGSGR